VPSQSDNGLCTSLIIHCRTGTFANSTPCRAKFYEKSRLTGTKGTLADRSTKFIADQQLDQVDVVGSSTGAPMSLELARRGHHGGSLVALNSGGFWTDTQVKVFGATVGGSIALVRRIQPLLPALTRSKVGRTALLA
jgi:hypothetical protein